KDGLSSVRSLPDVLGKIDEYRQQIVREWEARVGNPDPAAVWTATPPAHLAYPWLIGDSDSDDKAGPDDLKRRDAWRALFMPQGTILAARIDDRSWLTAGCGDFVPVLMGGSTVLMSKEGAEAPVRLGVFSPLPPSPATAPASAPSSAPATSQSQPATTS